MNNGGRPDEDWTDEMEAAARSMHRDWESPGLWESISARIAASEPSAQPSRPGRKAAGTRWVLPLAATLLLAASLPLIRVARETPHMSPPTAHGTAVLLTDPALAEIERAEASYARAIEALAAAAASRSAPDAAAPLLAALRERLTAIDAAIAECRNEIDGNRFNAHLRGQLLAMYREKRRTLEQILELESDAS